MLSQITVRISTGWVENRLKEFLKRKKAELQLKAERLTDKIFLVGKDKRGDNKRGALRKAGSLPEARIRAAFLEGEEAEDKRKGDAEDTSTDETHGSTAVWSGITDESHRDAFDRVYRTVYSEEVNDYIRRNPARTPEEEQEYRNLQMPTIRLVNVPPGQEYSFGFVNPLISTTVITTSFTPLVVPDEYSVNDRNSAIIYFHSDDSEEDDESERAANRYGQEIDSESEGYEGDSEDETGESEEEYTDEEEADIVETLSDSIAIADSEPLGLDVGTWMIPDRVIDGDDILFEDLFDEE